MGQFGSQTSFWHFISGVDAILNLKALTTHTYTSLCSQTPAKDTGRQILAEIGYLRK